MLYGDGENCYGFYLGLNFVLFCFCFNFVLFCFVLFIFGMRESWRTLGMYCRRIENLDWGASCIVRIYDI